MAKRTKRTRTERSTDVWGIVKFCAYVTMVVAAFAAMLAFVFGLVAKVVKEVPWAGRVTGICSMIAQISLIITVLIPAYHFMRTKSAVVRAFFWVAVIFLALGLIGLNLAFFR